MIYIVNIEGHYPVGACAVVRATDRFEARTILLARLAEESLDRKNEDLTIEDFVPIYPGGESAVVFLMNGDY